MAAMVALPTAINSAAVTAALRVIMASPEFPSHEVTGEKARISGPFGERRLGPGE
jgi:hypothetical protein